MNLEKEDSGCLVRFHFPLHNISEVVQVNMWRREGKGEGWWKEG